MDLYVLERTEKREEGGGGGGVVLGRESERETLASW